MDIRLTQINEKIKSVIANLQANGRVADPRTISNIARSEIEKLGNPTVDLIKIEKYSTISNQDWIKFINNSIFDLVVLRKVMLDFYQKNKESYFKNESELNKSLYDIDEMTKELESLTMISNDECSDYITESFVNTENISTGSEAVDLKYGNLQLPIERSYTRKVGFNLPIGYTPTVDILDIPIQNVLYSGSLSGSQFSNSLTDTNNIWVHTVKTKDYSKNVSIEFIIPVNDIFISEIDIEPYSDTPMDVIVHITNNGSTYYPVDQILSNGRELQFRFNNNEVKGIKIKATIKSPSITKHGISEYTFGFKNIAAMNVLYKNSFVSTTEELKGRIEQPIKSLSLIAEENIPDGADISYRVRGKKFNSTYTDWMDISPVNRPSKYKPEFLEIAGTSHHNQKVDITTNIRKERYEEIDFYSIGTVNENHNIDYRSLELYRAINGWQVVNKVHTAFVNTESRIDLRKDRDVPIHFYTTEESRFINNNIVAVKHKVDFNEAGQELIPRSKDSIDSGSAILSVKRYGFQSPIGFGKTGSGNKYYIDNGLSFPTLIPAILSEVATSDISVNKTKIQPGSLKAPGNIFAADVEKTETMVVQFLDGSISNLTTSVRTLLRIKNVTQVSPGSFTPIGSFSLTNISDISVVDGDGNESTLSGSGIINGNISSGSVISVTFNSYNTAKKPTDAGATTRGFYLVPNQEHVNQNQNIFKNNDVYDLPTPFPVRIITDSFNGIYEVDRISSIELGGNVRPILVISNPDKLGSNIPTAASYKINSWEIISQDLTSEVVKLFDDKIYFNEETVIEPGDKIEVRYRVGVDNSTIKVLPETVVVKDSETGLIFTEGKDYIYKDGLLHSTKENLARDIFISFTYSEIANSVYEATTYLTSINTGNVSLKVGSFNNTVFKPDTENAEFIRFDDKDIELNTVIDISKGLHEVKISAKDVVRLMAFINTLDVNGKPIFKTNASFSFMRGVLQPLTYVPYDVLKNSSYKGTAHNFSILDSEIIIPFNPNTNCFIDNRIYRVYKNEDIKDAIGNYFIEDFSKIPIKVEEFVLEYDYVKLENGSIDENLIEYITLEITLNKGNNKNNKLTPLLNGLTIRIN